MTDAAPSNDDELLAAFRRMSADVRHDDSLQTRNEVLAQTRLAADEARFGGLLRDIAEAGVVVTLDSTTGLRHRGAIDAIGRDYCVMGSIVIAAHAVAAVQVPGEPKTASAREHPTGTRSLAELLADWSADRLRVRIWVTGQAVPKGGELHSVGADMVGLFVDGQTIAIPIAAIAEVSNP